MFFFLTTKWQQMIFGGFVITHQILGYPIFTIGFLIENYKELG
jgi:hypothetical protein